MTKHDELVALLTEIRDTLLATSGSKPAPAAYDHTITTRNLEAFKHAVSKPMREHGECCEPAPADDLPGEPVEPGDLRAGDKVEFTYEGERITGTLVSDPDCDYILRSGTPDRDDYYPSVTLHGREWCGGISDVRLIERAPREDEDPDEALAKALYETECEVPWEDAGAVARDTYHDLARAARKHIEAEQEDAVAFLREEVESLTRRADGYRAEALQYGRAALDRAKERDGWKARHAALREDVEAMHLNPPGNFEAAQALDRDDKRAAKGEQR